MKKLLLFTILTFPAFFAQAASFTVLVGNGGFTYSPADLTVHSGDTVLFQGSLAFHPTVQVSQATWDANGTSQLPGGFAFTSGSAESLIVSGTTDIYYVCQNHVRSSGMKGKLSVLPTATRPTLSLQTSLYPNPAGASINLPAQTHGGNALLFQADGKPVEQTRIQSGQTQLPIRHLAPGSYVLLLNEQRYRFIKE